MDIVLACGDDVVAARAASDELAGLTAEFDKPFLHALSAQVTGAVLLAEEDPNMALVSLRRAWRGWRELEAPYEAARARVLTARACGALGDDGAEMELDAARSAFAELGATPDVTLVPSLSRLAAVPSRRRANGTRGRGTRAGGEGTDEPRRRLTAGHQREDGWPAT